MDGKEVIIRTLDIGADKQIGYFDLPKEDNPAMGMRALRICLTRPGDLQDPAARPVTALPHSASWASCSRWSPACGRCVRPSSMCEEVQPRAES